MFDQVAKEVIKAGLCANDTTIITKSDTTIKVDTLTIVDEQHFEFGNEDIVRNPIISEILKRYE